MAATEVVEAAPATGDQRGHGVASVVVRALEDRDGFVREHGRALQALEDAVRRGAAWAECAPLFDAVRGSGEGSRHASADAVCRTVGAYLLETGHAESWRALYPVLLAKFDIYLGWDEGYEVGDEVAFVGEAGAVARDLGFCDDGATASGRGEG